MRADTNPKCAVQRVEVTSYKLQVTSYKIRILSEQFITWSKILLGVGYPLLFIALVLLCCCSSSFGGGGWQSQEEEWVGDDHPQPRWQGWSHKQGGMQM